MAGLDPAIQGRKLRRMGWLLWMGGLNPPMVIKGKSMNVDQVLNEFKKSGARSIGQVSAAKPSPVRPN
jgi:hypothetical protein